MTRLLSSAALLLGLAVQPAFAAPTLRAEALVSSDVVTLGDLVDGAGAKAGIALFRAPDLGLTGAVPAATVIEAARQAGVADVSASGLIEVAVTRASREIIPADLARAVAARAAETLGAAPEDMRVTLDEARAMHLDPAAAGAIEIGRFIVDPRSGRFEAHVATGGRSPGDAFHRLTGTATETVEVAVAARPLARGDILNDADLIIERRPKMQNADAADLAGAKGLATRRSIREGQALRSGDLMRPQHVDRGAFVTLIYGGGGISLSLKVKALQSGAQGDLVSVQNLQSKRTVTGVVTGPSEVTVTAAPAAVARR